MEPLCCNLTDQQPILIPKLAEHTELKMKLTQKGGNWLFHDQEFWKLTERGEAIWRSTHLELCLQVMILICTINHQAQYCTPSLNPNTLETSPKKTYSLLSRACYAYHSMEYCCKGAKCTYQYKCYNNGCYGNHSAARCGWPMTRTTTLEYHVNLSQRSKSTILE